jgi:hypothetical protein
MTDKNISIIDRIRTIMVYNSSYDNTILEQNATVTTPGIQDIYHPMNFVKMGEDESVKYPNYCRHPEKTILPTKNAEGAEGVNALIPGYCYYKQPSKEYGKTSGIFIPKDSVINFWTIGSLNRVINNNYKKHYTEDKNTIINNISDILPIDTVSSFYIGDNRYYTIIEREKPGDKWIFKGFFREGDRQPYSQPSWVDIRTNYQKFVDQYGLAIQITAALGTAIAGAMTGGALWVLYGEIVLEGVLGTMVGLRELERGENVSAAMSFITGFLPVLKTVDWMRGVSSTTLKGLSKKFAEAGLTTSSSVDNYVQFYDKLSETEKYALSKILTQDEVSFNKILNQLKKIQEELPKLFEQGFINMVRENPNLLKSVSFFDKLWARELSANAVVLLVGAVTNIVWGKRLNDKEMETLGGIYLQIPFYSLKRELVFNMISNSDKIGNILNSSEYQKALNLLDIDKTKKNVRKYLDYLLQQGVEKSGGKYTQLPDDNVGKVESEKLTDQEEKDAREQGWLPYSEYEGTPENSSKDVDIRVINGSIWYKSKE